ncbi:MAG: ATP-binding protein, partial [Limisphaerales bacterium]
SRFIKELFTAPSTPIMVVGECLKCFLVAAYNSTIADPIVALWQTNHGRRGTPTMNFNRSSSATQNTAAVSLDHFFEASLELMCITDFDGCFQRLNPLWEQVLGFNSVELIGRTFVDFVHPEDRDACAELAAALIAGKPIVRFVNRVRTRKGDYRWFAWSANAAMNQGLIYATARDITQQKELEQKFLRSQRMEAVGALATGIAHDLNNILSPIMMAASLLEADDLSGTDLAELQSTIQSNVERGAGIVKQLLNFTRGTKDEESIVDPRHLAQDIVKLARETFPKNIDVRLSLPKDLWRVKANPTKVHQVLMNLAVNARDAMPNGGTFAISADNISLSDNASIAGVQAESDRAVRLTVSDTGDGIPPKLHSKVFDLFFTTKEHGKGTGLGLATVKGIVESLGGTITFTSDPGVGTSFDCIIPAVDQSAAVAELVQTPEKGTGETIMVVDDERSVREVIEKTLIYHGYNVLAARDGKEALNKFQNKGERIPLVIADVEMPVMDGLTMLLSMQRSTPDLKAVLCTGGQFRPNGVQLSTFQKDFGNCSILQKPFSVRSMLQLVKDQLATAPNCVAA